MVHKALLFAVFLFLLLLCNAPLDWGTIQTIAAWSQGFWGSLACLSVAMLTLIPALLTLGTGAAEALSALSFGLFFWGRFQVTHDLIPLLIFAVGAAFVAVEVLLVPGLGKPFVLGAVCISAAILKSFPDHQQGLHALLTAYLSLGAGLWFALRVLPRNRLANRFLALKPPTAQESAFDPGAELKQYLGMEGTTLTRLQPSGKIVVANKTLGARTSGAFVPAEAAVRVVRVESNQLIVEAVGE